MIYTSRYSNPELRSGNYTAVRISIGTPRWDIGFPLAGEIKDLMPFGLLDVEDSAIFKARYFEALNKKDVARIKNQLQKFETLGKSVVLLCYENIRKGDSNWCHRTMFAKWWLNQTGEKIFELVDNSKIKK